MIEHHPATDADFESLYAIHRLAFRAYVEQTWGAWDESTRRAEFLEEFQQARPESIFADGALAGCFRLEQHADCLFLDYIAVHPNFQNQGIGEYIVREILETARTKGQPVRLSVLNVNPAKRLYERLGFEVKREDDFRYWMKWEG